MKKTSFRPRFKVVTISGKSTPVDSLKDGKALCEYFRAGAQVVDQNGKVYFVKISS